MFAILWFLFIAFAATTCVVWVLDHNGLVVITWLGYEAKTDILTALLITIILAAIIFAASYLLALVVSLKFPNLFKLFFKKSYTKRLESLIHKHWQGIDVLQQLLLSLESNDIKEAENLQKKLSVLIKNPQLHNFFIAKISYQNKDFTRSAEYFEKINDNKFARLMVLKSKFNLAQEKKDTQTAIAYGKQILSSKVDSLKMATELLLLYRKAGLWQEARALMHEYGIEKFADELRKRELASINCAIACDFYHKKNYAKSSKYAKIALKADEHFLPAVEIQLKSWLKRGFGFCVKRKIKKLWKENPHLILIEIYDLANRKKSPQQRLKLIKKLIQSNNRSHLAELAIGLTALRLGYFKDAQEYLYNSLLKHKTYRAYKALAIAEKNLGNHDKAQIYFEKASLLSRSNHYTCSNCGNLSAIWKENCSNCHASNNYEWAN